MMTYSVLSVASLAMPAVLAQRMGMMPPGANMTADQGGLARFRSNPGLLRSMAPDMVTNAFCLYQRSEATTKLDRLYYDMLCDKVEREGIPPNVYDSLINGLIMGDLMAQPHQNEMMRGVLCPEGESCIVPLTLKGIWGYGCWCNFEVGLLEGGSGFLDGYDEICKNMVQCLRCAQMDGEADGEPCNPTTDPSFEYNADFSFNVLDEGISADCSEQNNGNLCATRACTCEMQLISSVLEALWTGTTYNFNLLHSQGFDPSIECLTPGTAYGAGTGDPQCCGYYPPRSVYNAAHRGCCDNGSVQTIFELDVDTCCPDGNVAFAGDIC